jgi:mRNA-decapping enzyme subunit 2
MAASSSSSAGTEWTLEKCLEDVEARFLYNLPEEEFSQADRLFFQIEQAWWFYEDFFADKYEHLPRFKKLNRFAEILFAHCPILRPLQHKFEDMFNEFGNYKNQIPVCGCILLNSAMTKVVLVCSWNGNSWGFPRGKINEGESPMACGVRETLEETGYDATANCKAEDFLVVMENGKVAQLYIAPNVPEKTVFETLTRKEISKIEFHPLDNLPKSYGVLPFLPKLRRWITNHRKGAKRSTSRSTSASAASVAAAADPSRVTPSRRDRRGSPGPGSANRSEKGESAKFNSRNGDTFTEDVSSGKTGWTVSDMFAANAKLTGRQFVYSGNPHEFGSSHPRFTDYRKPAEQSSTPASSGIAALDFSVSRSLFRDDTSSKALSKSYFPCPFVFNTEEIMAAVDYQLSLTM